ncbi:magnesium transporter MgtE N-terminal domain-containing protein [Corynebacterium epidermidicanis]|uniref:Mg/Co/Ni transporter MgtE with CBS domain n=1 Tax=Corynebacterium epidermidicanis TaxID=1050174 RepID=A0A0G3GVE8_9CORY|nr:CBS domain-containing protein [Corynebacterium epidermidicanis]AKK02832.1 Mg/Co/Ni transporter MgtE with CBS domain [Corynebacterium epidermidicanis]
MSSPTRVYVGRLSGMVVRGPDAESIGRVRDVVVSIRSSRHASRALGLVVEMTNKRRIFVPLLRVAAIEPSEITLVSGSVSIREFKTRAGELTVMKDLVGAKIHIDDPELAHLHGKPVEIADVEIERTRTRDWVLSRAAVFSERSAFGRRTGLEVTPWSHVQGISAGGIGTSNATAELIASFDDMRPADIATVIHELPAQQRQQVAEELTDDRLADIIQELPDDHQAELIESMDIERAADVLEEMDPDDAADLLGELPHEKADVLLELMDPEESAPVRRLMTFSPDTVGALMTPEPIILTPQTTVAEALAIVRNPELPSSLSSMVFVVRPPTATPTGKYLGCVHLQKLLREPPSSLIGGILDPDLPQLFANDSQETAARYFAMYNLVCGPVLDEDQHLLGAVAVDDLLDHLLPEDWREHGLRPSESSQGVNRG